MKKQLLLLLLSVVTVVANARMVTGVVTSASDGDPLMGVTVKVKGGTVVRPEIQNESRFGQQSGNRPRRR